MKHSVTMNGETIASFTRQADACLFFSMKRRQAMQDPLLEIRELQLFLWGRECITFKAVKANPGEAADRYYNQVIKPFIQDLTCPRSRSKAFTNVN